jgi:hypothetical protein
MTTREQLDAWANAANVQPLLRDTLDRLLDQLQNEWYNKGKSAGYNERAHVEWERR